jgi:anti-sigma factor RsiW
MRARETSGTPEDREVWRRSQEIDAVPDQAEHLLDLAAFVDNRLDEEDAARVAALIARDPAIADDVAAARALAGATMLPAEPEIVARAEALVDALGDDDRPEAELIAFPARPPTVRRWYSAATWSGLAAAVVLAGWLGFDLGSGISRSPAFSRAADDAAASELIDTTPLLLRDLTENSQT